MGNNEHVQTPIPPGSKARGYAILALIFIGPGLVLLAFTRSCDSEKTPTERTYKLAAEELVRRQLRDPKSAEFSGVIVNPASAAKSTVVCGWVNSRNGLGGMSGPQRFVVGNTVSLEEAVGTSQMDALWAQDC